MTRNETLIKRLDYFLEKKILVHVQLKDKRFFNGYVVERDSIDAAYNDTVYILEDRIVGLVHIFVSEIAKLEEYREE